MTVCSGSESPINDLLTEMEKASQEIPHGGLVQMTAKDPRVDDLIRIIKNQHAVSLNHQERIKNLERAVFGVPPAVLP